MLAIQALLLFRVAGIAVECLVPPAWGLGLKVRGSTVSKVESLFSVPSRVRHPYKEDPKRDPNLENCWKYLCEPARGLRFVVLPHVDFSRCAGASRGGGGGGGGVLPRLRTLETHPQPETPRARSARAPACNKKRTRRYRNAETLHPHSLHPTLATPKAQKQRAFDGPFHKVSTFSSGFLKQGNYPYRSLNNDESYCS